MSPQPKARARNSRAGLGRVRDSFEVVRAVGLTLPNVEATTKYDGSPILKLGGCFMAGLAMHPSAEPNTLVVRYDDEEREWLIVDAPETYYLTHYYRKYPLVLVRLSRINRDALRDMLSVSWRLTAEKMPARRRRADLKVGTTRVRSGSLYYRPKIFPIPFPI